MGYYIQTFGSITREQVLSDDNLIPTFDSDDNIISVQLKGDEDAEAIWIGNGNSCDYFKVKKQAALKLFKYLFETYDMWFGEEDILEDACRIEDNMERSKFYWKGITDYMLKTVEDWSEEDSERIKIHRRLWEIQ